MNKSILNGTLDILNTPLAHPVYTAELLRAIALDAASGSRESMDTLAMIFWRYGERFPEALVESIRTILKMDDLADTEVYTHLWNCSKEQGSLVGILNLYACIGYPQVEDEYLTRNSARFHEHLGFALVGTFHNCGYKFGRWYDMVWMEKIIGEHRPDQPPVQPYIY